MKIQKFNEDYIYEYDRYSKSKNISKKEYDFIDSFGINDIISWVSDSSKRTNLKEFTNLTKSEKDILKLSELKNLSKIKNFLDISRNIIKMENEYDKLLEERDMLYTDAANEVLYVFQEELINKDFKSFFEIFIQDSYEIYYYNNEQDNDNEIDYKEIYSDVHPRIMNKYKKEIIENVNMIIASKKYNI